MTILTELGCNYKITKCNRLLNISDPPEQDTFKKFAASINMHKRILAKAVYVYTCAYMRIIHTHIRAYHAYGSIFIQNNYTTWKDEREL